MSKHFCRFLCICAEFVWPGVLGWAGGWAALVMLAVWVGSGVLAGYVLGSPVSYPVIQAQSTQAPDQFYFFVPPTGGHRDDGVATQQTSWVNQVVCLYNGKLLYNDRTLSPVKVDWERKMIFVKNTAGSEVWIGGSDCTFEMVEDR